MPLRRLFGSVARFGREHPVIFGSSIAGVKTSSSDLFAQTQIEGRKEIDWRRNSVFFVWGLVYLGGVQYFIYVRLFTKHLFPTASAFAAKPLRDKLADTFGQKVVLKQVFLDQFVHHPFMFFPLFYQVKELIEGGTPADAVSKYVKNFSEDMQVLWSIWVPAFLFNFSFCPNYMRVPFVAAVSFGFTIILSTMRGSREELIETDASLEPSISQSTLTSSAET